MKYKYIFSVLSSLFLVTSVKAQTKEIPVKKETTPQVKTKPDVSTNDKEMKMKGEKHGKDNVLQKGSETNLPITVKPGNENVLQKGSDTNLPITVKSGKDNVSQKQASTSLPITVKPGDQIFSADFNKDDEGEMPVGWKSNGMGTLTRVEGREGKWLKIEENTKYETALAGSLPKNFTIEFDFIANYKDDQGVPELVLRAYKKGDAYREPGVSFLISPNGGSVGSSTRVQVASHLVGGGEKFRSTARHLDVFEPKNKKNEPVRIVMTVKGQQVKTWIDGEKVYDLQEVVPQDAKFDRFSFETGSYGGPKNNYQYYISNIKVTAN